jgi:hypothetical protein
MALQELIIQKHASRKQEIWVMNSLLCNLVANALEATKLESMEIVQKRNVTRNVPKRKE